MLNYIIYRTGQLLALILPLKLAYKIAMLISDIRYIFAYQDRKFVTENLKVIFPEKPDKEIKIMRINLLRNFAKYLVDFFRFQKIDRKYIERYIRIENINYFNEGLARGRGVITLTAHIGNWELGGVVISLLGYSFWVVALPHKYKRVDDFFNTQREIKGLKVIPLGKAIRQCLKLLRENKMVGLVGDRTFSERGIILDFFGRDTVFPEGPAALALQTGAAIVPGFMLRNKDDTFTLRIEKPLDYLPTGDSEKDIKNVIGLYRVIFQDYIRKYPDQWYMFRRFWVE
jgi:KDO2-lipid IV(A) lauroyltransferase